MPEWAGARVLATAGLATVVCAGMAGCTITSPNGNGDSDQSAAWAAVTSCIRSHGQPDWPDPTVGTDRQLGFPADAPHTTDQVQRACAAQFAALSVRNTATAVPTSSADLALLLRLAQCLRAHGYATWPDPGPDGRFPYAAISALPNVKQLLTNPPTACRVFVPRGGIRVAT